MVTVEVSIVPLGSQSTSLSEYVAGCVKIARESGIPCQLTAMGTILEGEDLDSILACVRRMQESVFAAGIGRVYSVLKIDDRRDRSGHGMAAKMAAVEGKL